MIYSVNLGRTGMLDIDKIKEIDTENPENQYGKIQFGGLWASREGNTGWEEICKREYPDWLSNENAKVTVKDNARILILDSEEKYEQILQTHGRPNTHRYYQNDPHFLLNYGALKKDYDIIEFRVDDYPDLHRMLGGNNLEIDSVLIMNKDAIEKIENPPEITMYDPRADFLKQYKNGIEVSQLPTT